MATEEFNADEALELIKGLRESAKADFASFKKKVKDGSIQTTDQLLAELTDLFSLTVDLSEMTLHLHTEHMEWSEGIEEEIDQLKEGGDASALLPTDAAALKATLLALGQNLRASTGPDDHVPELLTTKIADTIAFIDGITIADDEEGGGDADDDEEEETEED
jgi:hypothetical protein